MKQFLLFVSLLVFFACQSDAPNEETIPAKATLTGKITNAKADIVKLSAGDQKLEASLNDNGEFTLDVPLAAATSYRFFHGGEQAPMFVEPR